MEDIWTLPKVETITNTGPDWIIHLLDGCTSDTRLPVIMTLWQNWHVRNEVYHGKPAPSVEASCRFLNGYNETLLKIQQRPNADIVKGKTVVLYDDPKGKRSAREMRTCIKPMEHWRKPSQGSVKLNVDGSWVQEARM